MRSLWNAACLVALLVVGFASPFLVGFASPVESFSNLGGNKINDANNSPAGATAAAVHKLRHMAVVG